MADRGQSEVIGFVLVFGLIISTVALASVAGFSGLQNVRDFDRVANAQHAFDILADAVDDVAHHGAPSRMTEMRADRSQVFVGQPVTIGVTVADPGDPGSGVTHQFAVDPIVYEGSDGTRLVYVAGAVIREDQGGAVVLRDPEFLLGADHSVVQIIQTEGETNASVGSKTVTIRTDGLDEQVVAASPGRSTVTLTIDSPRATAWEHSFEAQGLDCTRVGSQVTCEITSDAAYVSVAKVDVVLS